MNLKKEYRETRTGDVYLLRYEQDGNTWRVYADTHPVNPYDPSVIRCHLFSSGELCIDRAKFNPDTLERAKACAYFWMEGYSQYVRKGNFPATGGRVMV
jgi:hypothetical protein